MTTHSPAQPLTTSDETTEVLAPQVAEKTLDALPLLDPGLLAKTTAPALALRGHYVALSDGADTRLLRLERDTVHLGRGASAEIRFDHHLVSRDHAILVRHGGHLRLLDNRSSNGTYVNGRRISATNLSSGDVIDLGPVRIQLLEVR
jgi:pSer/pThr/pTyr-binding forkhead associated (FHA) protein